MKRITTADVSLGAPLPWTAYDQYGNVLLRKGYVMDSRRKLEMLVRRGFYTDNSLTRQKQKTEPIPPEKASTPIYQVIRGYQATLDRVFEDYLQDRYEDLSNKVGELAEALETTCQCDAATDSALAALHLDRTRYCVTHALQVAVLSNTLARETGCDIDQRQTLIRAALTHDLGILHIQEELDQQSELTDEQWAEIRRHPSRSVEALRRAGVDDGDWLDTVMAHHERPDGSGYEFGSTGEEIPMMARILAVCDIYSAMIRERPYRPAIVAKDALRDIFLSRGEKVDPELAQLFIKTLGVYPPGSVARLANGEIGVVMRRGKNGISPVVRSMISPRGAPLLRALDRDTSVSAYAIKEMAQVSEHPFVTNNLHLLWPS